MARAVLLLAGGALLAMVQLAHGQSTDGPTPNPSLTPDEVVRIQLEALRANDQTDRGIEICFRFASPENKQQTGPVERFSTMIKQGPYALMLSYNDASFEPVQVQERTARQVVTLVGPNGAVTYSFWLSKQTDASCEGCWMTDAVHVEAVHDAA